MTGTTVALGITNRHRHFLSCLPNNESLRFEDLDLSALDGCAHLLRADVWFSQAMLEGGNLRLFQEARRRGVKTSLDINFDPCWSTGNAKQIARRKALLREALEPSTSLMAMSANFASSPTALTLRRLCNAWRIRVSNRR